MIDILFSFDNLINIHLYFYRYKSFTDSHLTTFGKTLQNLQKLTSISLNFTEYLKY